MNSIAEIFDNSKQLLDGIDGFISKYMGCDLLRRCGIRKIVDSFTEKRDYEYVDNPILRLIGDVKTSKNFLLTRSLPAFILRQALISCSRPVHSSVITAKTRSIALTLIRRLTGNVSSLRQQRMLSWISNHGPAKIT